MSPGKLAKFSKNQLVNTAANKYLQHIVQQEIPCGLKQYLEDELFPWIYLRVRRGILLSTARYWLHLEGFQYISHKKGLYFDGHNQPDVLTYHQNHFLPTIKAFKLCLV
jgi:hypothetical protein